MVVVLVVVVIVVRHAEACLDCAGIFVKKCSKHGKKSARTVREFLKKCLKFRDSVRKLLVVFSYFPADAHK